MKLHFQNLIADIEAQDAGWRNLAQDCADYYDHRQLTPERQSQLDDCERLPVVGNLILPAVNSVLGHEAANRRDWRVVADDPDSGDVADALNQRLNEVARICKLSRYCADAYKHQLVKGLGWVFIDKNPDAFGKPYVVETVPITEVYWDMRSIDPELADCRWIARRKFMDFDEALARFPDDKSLIKNLESGWGVVPEFEVGDLQAQEATGGENWGVREAEFDRAMQKYPAYVFLSGSERKRVAVYEVYYRVFVEVDAVSYPDGRIDEADIAKKREGAKSFALLKKLGLLQETRTVTAKIRRKWFIGPHEVADEPSPHPHNCYPFVPFFGYREDRSNTPYGIVRGMLGPQDKYNEAEWTVQELIEHLQIFFNPEKLADKNMKASDLIHEVRRKDGVIALSDMSAVRVERDLQRLQEMHIRKQEAREEVRMFSGIYEAYSGATGNLSGVAANTLASLGATTLAEINDNYELARNQCGLLMLAYLVEEIGEREITVTVFEPGSKRVKKTVTLNSKDEEGRATNRLLLARYQVALADAASSPGNMQQANRDFAEMYKSSQGDPALMRLAMKGYVKTSAVPDKDDLLIEWEEATGQGDPEAQAAMQQQAMAVQQQKLKLEQAEAEAKIKENLAQAQREEAHAAYYTAQAAKVIKETEKISQEQERERRRADAAEILEMI